MGCRLRGSIFSAWFEARTCWLGTHSARQKPRQRFHLAAFGNLRWLMQAVVAGRVSVLDQRMPAKRMASYGILGKKPKILPKRKSY
jgi:hypothetical protein